MTPQKMTTEQELINFLEIAIGGIEYPDCDILAKAILSSGLVIPVSALDGMVEKVAEALDNEEGGLASDLYEWIDAAKAAINAIKQEAGQHDTTGTD